MKIRTDFVTNSSSSSFITVVNVTDKNGKVYKYCEVPDDYSPDWGGTSSFRKSLKGVIKEYNDVFSIHFRDDFQLQFYEDRDVTTALDDMHVGTRTVLALKNYTKHDFACATFDVIYHNIVIGYISFVGSDAIIEAIKDGVVEVESAVSYFYASNSNQNMVERHVMIKIIPKKYSEVRIFLLNSVKHLCALLMDNVDDGNSRRLQSAKKKFTEEVISNIRSVNEIKSIELIREYEAWGEGGENIADGDDKLLKLAKKVKKTSGPDHKKALQAMLDYINTPKEKSPRDEEFGKGFTDFRYKWDGGENELEMLAERLCGPYGPQSNSGMEYSGIDFETGILTEYASFDLE